MPNAGLFSQNREELGLVGSYRLEPTFEPSPLCFLSAKNVASRARVRTSPGLPLYPSRGDVQSLGSLILRGTGSPHPLDKLLRT